MKLPILYAAVLLIGAPALRAEEKTPPPAPTAPAAQTHPLKGVILGILAEKSSLLVKHEDVPGVMRAMTMLFKVDPAVLAQVKRHDAITARMARRDDGWWLTDIEVLPPQKH